MCWSWICWRFVGYLHLTVSLSVSPDSRPGVFLTAFSPRVMDWTAASVQPTGARRRHWASEWGNSDV
jgi:hypothetical protein